MRHLKKLGLVSAASALALLTSSCGATLGEYKKFADAGREYAVAMDSLLATSANVFVSSSSENLLAADEQIPANDRVKYAESKKTLEGYLRQVALARRHTVLLAKYFRSLEDLASSDAPQKAQETSTIIFTQLTDTGNRIAAIPGLTTAAADSLSKIPSLIISAQIEGALRAELAARKNAIYREMVIQEHIQKLLARQIQSDVTSARNFKENRTIKPAYVSSTPIESPSEWIAMRAEISSTNLTSEALDEAAETSRELIKAFEDLLSDRLTAARASALVDSIRQLSEIARGLRKASSQN